MNRLSTEDSPYLQQHKNNPVHWYPWCDEAFEKAKNEKKPIFLSIGYSSCHWCHVMEHEVFENETIANVLNEHFISIKVDREERPDIDKYYQEVYMLLNRRAGGWPTSIFSTYENEPIYAGTYIPPKRQHNMMGFDELIDVIATKVRGDDAELFKNAKEIQHFLKPKDEATQATKLNTSAIDLFIKEISSNYERTYGGFSTSPKFPHVYTHLALLDVYHLRNDQKMLDMVTHSLKEMTKGGLFDHVDGGFCRYSTDDKWLVPHFEKMTYDNGLLAELYIKSYEATNDPFFLNIAKNIHDFMIEKMRENNLFYSASDADTEGEEGKYFVYDHAELKEKFTPEQLKAMSITPSGNFEGHSIVRFDTHEIPKWFTSAKKELQTMRQTRTYPFIDKKVLVSWNAMMIKALFLYAKHDTSYLDQATVSLDTLMQTMHQDDTLYHSCLINKLPKIEAFLEDYAFLVDALLQAYQVTLKEEYLIYAQKLSNDALTKFYEGGKWNFSIGEFKTEAQYSDSSYHSSLAIMTHNLLTLGSLIDPKYRHFAFKTLEFNSIKLMKHPNYMSTLFRALMRYLHEEVVVKLPKEHYNSDISTSYPFVLKHINHEDENIMLCTYNSCFSNVESVKEIDKKIKEYTSISKAQL